MKEDREDTVVGAAGGLGSGYRALRDPLSAIRQNEHGAFLADSG
jgi:hypothetical protein